MNDTDSKTIYKLTPSDLTYLYEGCKRCFSLKIKHGVTQPSMPLPGIFTTIAGLQSDYYGDVRTEEICDEIPSGKITLGEKWVESRLFDVPDTDSKFYIKGRFDVVAELDDNTYSVMDFKVSKPSNDKNMLYGRQLHAYAVSLETPGDGSLELSPITKLGLLYFVPNKMSQDEKSIFNLAGDIIWNEVERDDNAFFGFMHEVVRLLDGPIPAPDNSCDWCSYLNKSDILQDDLPECPTCGGEMQLKKGKYGEFLSCKKYPECKGTRNI